MDGSAFIARVVITFLQYFVGVGYPLWVLSRFGKVLSALPLLEGLLLLIVGGLGCYSIVRGLGRWKTSFEQQGRGGGKAA